MYGGQEWQALMDLPIFRKTQMDKILDEIIVNEGDEPLKMSNAFMPFTPFDSTDLIAAIQANITGRTQPYSLSGDVPLTTLPGFYYKEYGIGYWREAIMWDEKTIQTLKSPTRPDKLAGEELMARSLAVLKKRGDNLIEWTTAMAIIQGGYDVAGNKIAYRYLHGLPDWFYIKMGTASHTSPVGVVFRNAPWVGTPADNRLWSDTTNSNPLQDIADLCDVARRKGLVIEEFWLTTAIGSLIQQNANTKVLIAGSPELSRGVINVENIILAQPALKGLRVVLEDRLYQEETYCTKDIASADTTLTVDEISPFAIGQDLTLVSQDGKTYKDVKVHASTPPSGKTITLTAAVGVVITGKTRVVVGKSFLADKNGKERYVIFKCRGAEEMAVWASTPSIVAGSLFAPRAGRYTWVYQSPDPGQPWIRIGAGVEGGPVVWATHQAGWFVLQVR